MTILDEWRDLFICDDFEIDELALYDGHPYNCKIIGWTVTIKHRLGTPYLSATAGYLSTAYEKLLEQLYNL